MFASSAETVHVGVSASAVHPRTTEQAQRVNQIKQQLGNPIIVPEAAEAFATWSLGVFEQFRRINSCQDWDVQQIALTEFRINRIQRVERRLRDVMALRAIDFWEDDQRLAAEKLALKIKKEPGYTVSQLLCTPTGCDWLIERWEDLARVGLANWNDERTTLTGHLMRGRPMPRTPEAIAERIAGLRDQREPRAEVDAIRRELAEADLSEDLTPELKQARRHEQELLTRLRWFTREARVDPMDRRVDERYVPQ